MGRGQAAPPPYDACRSAKCAKRACAQHPRGADGPGRRKTHRGTRRGKNRQPDFEEYTRATAAAFAADEQRNVLPSRRIAAQLVRQKAQPVSLLSSRTHKVGLRRLKHLRRRTFVTPLRKPKQRSRAWGSRLLEIIKSAVVHTRGARSGTIQSCPVNFSKTLCCGRMLKKRDSKI